MFGQKTCRDEMCERGKLFLRWSHGPNKWVRQAGNLPEEEYNDDNDDKNGNYECIFLDFSVNVSKWNVKNYPSCRLSLGACF